MTEVVAEAAPGWPAAILSGPSFAVDVAAGLPTAVTLASADEALARALCGGAARAEPQALSFDRPARRRDRRRGQERAGDRLRRRRGARARRQRRRGADRARLRRAQALRRRLRRAADDADGPFRARRPGADLLVARNRATSPSAGARARRERRRGGRRQAGRRRADRRGADADGARARRRHADLGRRSRR